MRSATLVSAALIVGACAVEPTFDQLSYSEQEAFIEQLAQVCEAQGVKRYTDEMETCLRSEFDREDGRRRKAAEDRELFGAALGAGLTSYGNSRTGAASTYRAPIRCSSSQLGSTINTTCY